MSDQNQDEPAELMRQASRLRFENPGEAQRLYEKAVESSRKSGSRPKLIQALKGLGQIARDTRLNGAALLCYKEAVALCRAEVDELQLAHTVRHLGDIHQDMRRTDLAGPCYEEALAIYRSNGKTSTLDLANTVRPLALLKETTGDMQAAKRLWSEARDLYAAVKVSAGVKECSRRLSLLKDV